MRFCLFNGLVMYFLVILFVATAPQALFSAENVFSENSECENFSIEQEILNTSVQSVQEKTNILYAFAQSCPSAQVDPILQQTATAPSTEWFLKQKALELMSKEHICSQSLQNYLFSFLLEEKQDWHIRSAVVWTLSKMPIECEDSVVHFLTHFIQQEQPELTMEQIVFRQEIIDDLFWALVHLGVNHQSELVVQQLKTIAMNENLNMHFRRTAISALQDMSAFMELAGLALYEIVRDSVKPELSSHSKKFETYYQSIQNKRNIQIQASAFSALTQVIEEGSKFFSFLSERMEKTEEQDRHRWQALAQLKLPDDVTQYARSVLIKMSSDAQVSTHYRNQAVQYSESAATSDTQ